MNRKLKLDDHPQTIGNALREQLKVQLDALGYESYTYNMSDFAQLAMAEALKTGAIVLTVVTITEDGKDYYKLNLAVKPEAPVTLYEDYFYGLKPKAITPKG